MVLPLQTVTHSLYRFFLDFPVFTYLWPEVSRAPLFCSITHSIIAGDSTHVTISFNVKPLFLLPAMDHLVAANFNHIRWYSEQKCLISHYIILGSICYAQFSITASA